MKIKRVIHIELEAEREPIVRELLDYLKHTGKISEFRLEEAETPAPAPSKPDSGKTQPKSAGQSVQDELYADFAKWKESNTLLRVKAVKGRGKHLDIAARIVGIDPASGTLVLYDVDNKRVEGVKTNEIEYIEPAAR